MKLGFLIRYDTFGCHSRGSHCLPDVDIAPDLVPEGVKSSVDGVLLVGGLELAGADQDCYPLQHHFLAVDGVYEVLDISDLDHRLEGALGHGVRIREVSLVDAIEVGHYLLLALYHQLDQLVDLSLRLVCDFISSNILGMCRVRDRVVVWLRGRRHRR